MCCGLTAGVRKSREGGARGRPTTPAGSGGVEGGASFELPSLDTMVSVEPLFPRAEAPKAKVEKKKAGFLQRSLGFLMEDTPGDAGQGEGRPIDYGALKQLIRQRIVDALFKYLDETLQLKAEKRREIESVIQQPRENSLAAEDDVRYVGLKTLFDIRLRLPGGGDSAPLDSWLGESPAYGVPSWVVRLSVIEPLLDSLSPEDRQKLLAYIEKCVLSGTEPGENTVPFPPDHPCAAVFTISAKFTEPDNIDIVRRAREIPGKASLIGPQLHHVKTPEHVALINDTGHGTLAGLINTVRSAQRRAEEFCEKHSLDSLPKDAMSSGDAFEDMCACNLMLMKLLTKDADDVKGRERWVTFLSDMLNSKGLDTWPTLNKNSGSLDLMRDHVEALQVIMDNLEHFSEGKIRMFLESFGSIEQMERFYNKLKEDFPESLKIILPLPNFDAILRKAADAFKMNHKADYDTVVHTMRTRLEALLSNEQKRDANAVGNVRGTQF